MFDYTFSYDSNRLGEIKLLESCPVVHVTVTFEIYQATNYDTPLESDKKWAVGNNCIESVFAEGFGDVTDIKDDDLDFLEEIVKQIEKREPQMVDFARGKM